MKRNLLAIACFTALAACSTNEAMRLAKGEPPPLSGELAGEPWIVEDVNGGGVIDNVRLDLTFGAGGAGTGRVSGTSGCNRFTADWQQRGSAIDIGPTASTRMACPPALMDLEGKFLTTLEAVTTVSFDATGAALLKATDGRAIKMRREKR